MKRWNWIAGMMIPAVCAAPAIARKDDRKVPPPVLAALLDCRAVADSAARLACFDASAASLERAYSGGDIAMIDREDVRKTKRGLFGFSFSDLPIFGDRNKDDGAETEEIKEIVTTIKAVSRGSDGGWRITLEDGAHWEQTDATVLGRSPKAGGKVTIRRAALGSYKMTFEVGPSVKARRVN